MVWIGVSKKAYDNIFQYGSIQNNEKREQFNEDKGVQCAVAMNATMTLD